MPETLLHSWTRSTHFECKFHRQVTLAFLGRPPLQHLEGRALWSSLLLSTTFLHVIPYSEGLLMFYKCNYNNFLKDKVAQIIYLPFQRKEDFEARTRITILV